MILRFKEFQFCLELVIFYLLQLQALSFIFLLYHLITQEYIKEAAKQHTDYTGTGASYKSRLTPSKSG